MQTMKTVKANEHVFTAGETLNLGICFPGKKDH